jgi:oligoribonuclease
MPLNPSAFLWCDLETTGLEPYKGDKILEFAFRLTTFDLNSLWEYERVVHHSRSEWAALKHSCRFVYDMHTENGLLEESARSYVTCDQVENDVVAFFDKKLPKFNIKSEELVLAGSSIHFDKKWLEWFAPLISERLHYRVMDVSSLYPVLTMLGLPFPNNPKVHRAMADIDRSIKELRDIIELLRK